MKPTTLLCSLFLLIILMLGCNNKGGASSDKNEAADSLSQNKDSTIYGTCTEAAMSSFSMVNEHNDTLFFLLEEVDTVANVQGGIFEGDKLAVVAHVVDGEMVAQKVININSLRGRWISLDKNFEIKDDGVVESSVEAESNPYTSWRIWNGLLILSKDTFNILQLGPDSLFLENQSGIFTYKRL